MESGPLDKLSKVFITLTLFNKLYELYYEYNYQFLLSLLVEF